MIYDSTITNPPKIQFCSCRYSLTVLDWGQDVGVFSQLAHDHPNISSSLGAATIGELKVSYSLFLYTCFPQTASIFTSVLFMMVFLAHSSLISVISYTALSILTSVATIKIYAFVMVKMGKVDHDFDPLAPVSMLFAHLFNCRHTSFFLTQISTLTLTLPESIVTQYTPVAISAFNQATNRAKSLFLLESPVSRYLSTSRNL